MMKNNRLKLTNSVLAILALFALSCQDQNPLSPSSQLNYFPLAVGNEWIYSALNDTTYRDTSKIFDGVVIGNQIYYTYGSKREYALLIRQSTDGKIYLRVNNEDRLYFDFTTEDGKTYRFKGFGSQSDFAYLVTVRKHLTVESLAGKFEDCVDLSFDTDVKDAGFGYVFAPDVGIVKKYGAWIGEILFSYALN